MTVDTGCVYPDNMAISLNLCAQGFQHLDGGIDIAQKGDIADLAQSRGQYGRNKKRQGSIFRTADRHLAF